MDEQYLQNLYEWIKSNDSSYEGRYSYDQFTQKMQDESYASKMHSWISGIDNTFEERRPLNNFLQMVKKKEEGFGRIFSQPFEQAQEAVDQLQEQKAQEQGVQLAPEGTFLRQMQTSSLASEPINAPLELPSELEDRKYKAPITPETPTEELYKILLPKDIEEAKAAEMNRQVPEFLKPSINVITGDFLNRNNNIVKQELEYYLGPAGFTVEDDPYLTLVAPNGERASVKGANLKTVADELKIFVKENSAKLTNLSKLEKQYADENKKYTTKKAYDDDMKSLNVKANEFNAEQNSILAEKLSIEEEFNKLNSIPDNKKDTPEFKQLLDIYKKRVDDYELKASDFEKKALSFQEDQDQLDKVAAKYAEMKSTQGGWFKAGFIPNLLNLGFEGNLKGLLDLGVDLTWDAIGGTGSLKDVMGESYYNEQLNKKIKQFGYTEDKLGYDLSKGIDYVEIKKLPEDTKEKVYEAISKITSSIVDDQKKTSKRVGKENISVDFKNLRLSDVSDEWFKKQEQTTLGGAIIGVGKTLPSLIGFKWMRQIYLYAQATNALQEEMDNNPNFDNISEAEKLMIKIPYGIASAALEELGFGYLLKNKPFVNNLTRRILGAAPTGVSASQLRNIALFEIKRLGLKSGVPLAKAAIGEAFTGASQEAVGMEIKNIYNVIKEKEMFKDVPMSIAEQAFNLSFDDQYWKNVAKAGIQEGIGGIIMKMPNAVSSAFTRNSFQEMYDDRFELFEDMHLDPEARALYELQLKFKVNNGDMTQEESDKALNQYDQSAGLLRQIPPQITNVSDKKIAMDLLVERKRLEDSKESKDPALSKPIQERINAINKQLTKITQDAIQKQESGEVPVQSETGVSEEVVEREPQAGLEVTTQESEATAQEEVTTEPSFTEQDNSRMNELSEALGRSDKRRKNITVGDTEMSRKDAQAELDALMQKQQQQQQTPELAPQVSSKTESMTVEEQADLLERLIEESMTEPTTETKTEPVTETKTEPVTKGRTRTRTKAKQEPELVTTQEPVVTPGMEVQAPAIETGVTPAVEPATTPTTEPSTTPTTAPVTEVATEPTNEQEVDENAFTEADAERQAKLSEALSYAAGDSRVKFVKLDGEFVPKGEVVAELQRLFQKKLNQTNARARLGTEEEAVDQAEIDKITKEMNALSEKYPQEAEMGEIESAGEISVENPIDTNPTPEPVKKSFLDKLLKFLGYNKNQLYRDIREFAGMPMMIGISDSLGSGSFKDAVGNELKLDGGLMFNFFRNINKAWANVDKKFGDNLVEQAKKVYNANKELFDRLWDEGKLPKGHIPYAIVRMGDEALLSNEAIYRYVSPWLKTLPLKNRKAALEVFKAQMQEAAKDQSASGWLFDLKEKIDDGEIGDFEGIINYLKELKANDKITESQKKAIGKYENKLKALKGEDLFEDAISQIDASLNKAAPVAILNFINKNNITTLDELFDAVAEDAVKRAEAKSERPSSLSLPLRNILTKKLFSQNNLTKITKGQPIYQALLGAEKNKLWDGLKYLTIPHIREQISEPAMLKARPGDVVAIMGINVLEGSGVEKANHNNYGFGPNGRLISYIKNPMRAFDIFPEIKAKAAKIFKPDKNGNYPALSSVVSQSGGTAFVDKSFRGTKPVTDEMTKLDIIIGKLRTAFPDVSVLTTQEEFDAFLNEEGIRSRKDSNGNIIYGVTKDGKIFLNPENKSLKTPIHEFGHIWIDYLRSKASGTKGTMLLEKGFQLIDGTKEYKQALKKYGDRGIALEEALVEYIATKGNNIINAADKSKFKNWLNAFFRYIKEKFVTSKQFFKDKEFQQKLEKMTIDQFANVSLGDLFGMAEVSSKFSAKDAAMAERARRSVGMSPEAMVKLAKKNEIADEAIRMILTKKGFTEEKINELLGAEPTAREKGKEPKLSEANFPGYDAIMDLVDAMIARQVKRGTPKDRLAKNLDNLLRKQDAYINATDAQKKALEQEARNRIGAEQRKAPSFGRILGAFKDITNLDTKDKKTILKNIMALAKDAANDLANEIKGMKVNGKISTSQLTAIQKRLSRVNFTNERSVSSFVDYMANVFNDIEYDNNMQEIRKMQAQAKRKKHPAMSDRVKQFTSINPERIPTDMLMQYMQALDALNNRTPSYNAMNDIFQTIIDSAMPDDAAYDSIKNMEAMANKWESISLNKVKSVEDYVNLIRDISAYRRNALRLLNEGAITQDQYDTLMEAVGKDQAAVEQKYKKELDALKDDLLKGIKSLRPSTSSNFTNEENALIKKYLELSDNDIKSLSPTELYILNDLLDNIKSGEFDYYRFSEVLSKAYTNEQGNKLAEQSKNINLNSKNNEVKQKLSEYESSFWEGLLGFGSATSSALQRFVVSPFNRAIASFENYLKDGNNKFLDLKKKYNIKEKDMHKLGMLTTYLQEYMAQFDASNQGVKNIGSRDWFREIINNDEMRGEYNKSTSFLKKLGIKKSSDDKIIEQIWNSLPKDSDGNVSPKAVFDSFVANDGKFFTKNEKQFFDEIMDWKEANVATKQRAANYLRGNPFEQIPFHMTRKRLGGDPKQVDARPSGANGLVRLESETGKERTSQKVGPIETNFEKLFIAGLEQTGRDYFITSALKDINNVLSITKNKLGEGKGQLVNILSNTLSDALAFEFEKTSSQYMGDVLLSARMATTLYDPFRTVVELMATFASYPVRSRNLAGYKALYGQVANMKELLEFTESPLRLRNNINKAIDINDGNIKRKSKTARAIDYLSGLPERTMMVTSWMPTFKNEFEMITGVAFDMKKFKSDANYREQYGKAIKEASAEADAQTEKIIGTTTKAGQRREIRIAPKLLANIVGLEGTVPKNSALGKIVGFFSNYPYREVTEFFNGFKEAYQEMRKGNYSQAPRQLLKPLGVAINVSLYSYLSSVAYAMTLILLGGEDDREKGEKQLKDLFTWAGYLEETLAGAISLVGSKYSAGGKAMLQASATAAMLAPIDSSYKKHIPKLLKNSVFVEPIDVEKVTEIGGDKELASVISKYIPQMGVIINRFIDGVSIYKDLGKIYDKVTENGIESLTSDEQLQILALDTFINSFQIWATAGGGSLPAYNKIKVWTRGLRKDSGVDRTKSQLEKIEAYGGYKTIDDLEENNPDLYEKLAAPGGPLYELREKRKEAKRQKFFEENGYYPEEKSSSDINIKIEKFEPVKMQKIKTGI